MTLTTSDDPIVQQIVTAATALQSTHENLLALVKSSLMNRTHVHLLRPIANSVSISEASTS